MKNLLRAKSQEQTHPPRKFEFSSEGLTYELYRLKDLFLPEFKIPNIKIEVGKHTYTKAALTYYNQNRIVLYKPYHLRFPTEYKSTLLHELGHIVADHTHEGEFRRYYNLLVERQQGIEEEVIPSEYVEFLFSKVTRHYSSRYYCPICRTVKVYRKRIKSVCNTCAIPMLEDMMFEGIEAIVPDSFKQTVNKSVLGRGCFSSKDSLV